MPEIYYYVTSDRVQDILDCGLKLSGYYDKEVWIQGEVKQCFSGFLNPRDGLQFYESSTHTCLKLQVKSSQCFVADRFIYETCSQSQKGMEHYDSSIIPLEQYRFGQYRMPECLVATTILDSEVTRLGKVMDSPVIYTASEELYINNLLYDLREQNAEMDNDLLYYFFDHLAQLKKIDKIESSGPSAIFLDRSGKTYCLKQPQTHEET